MENRNEKIKELKPEELEQVSGGNEVKMNRVYTCGECGETFESFGLLSLHAVNKHPYSKKPQR